MAELSHVLKAASPSKCSFSSFPAGLNYITLVLYTTFLIVAVFMQLTGSGFGSGVFVKILLFAPTLILLLYSNYYYVEGCVAKKILRSLNQEQTLKNMMGSKKQQYAPVVADSNVESV